MHGAHRSAATAVTSLREHAAGLDAVYGPDRDRPQPPTFPNVIQARAEGDDRGRTSGGVTSSLPSGALLGRGRCQARAPAVGLVSGPWPKRAAMTELRRVEM
jgi:hypothetical protein